MAHFFKEGWRMHTQQSQDSWAKTDGMPIYKRSNRLRIDLACKVYGHNHGSPDISRPSIFMKTSNSKSKWEKENVYNIVQATSMQMLY